MISINRVRAKALRVPVSQISSTVSVFMGSAYVNDSNYNNRSYRVYVQAKQNARMTPADLRKFYVRSDSRQMVTLDNLVTIAQQSGPQVISHYNLFRAAEIDGSSAPGYSTGEGLANMEALA